MKYQVKTGLLGKRRVVYECPKCEADLYSMLEEAGKPDKCPECGVDFTVPGSAELQRQWEKIAEQEQLRLERIKTANARKDAERQVRQRKLHQSLSEMESKLIERARQKWPTSCVNVMPASWNADQRDDFRRFQESWSADQLKNFRAWVHGDFGTDKRKLAAMYLKQREVARDLQVHIVKLTLPSGLPPDAAAIQILFIRQVIATDGEFRAEWFRLRWGESIDKYLPRQLGVIASWLKRQRTAYKMAKNQAILNPKTTVLMGRCPKCCAKLVFLTNKCSSKTCTRHYQW